MVWPRRQLFGSVETHPTGRAGQLPTRGITRLVAWWTPGLLRTVASKPGRLDALEGGAELGAIGARAMFTRIRPE